MPKKWQNDEDLLSGVSSHLLDAVSMFPRRLLRVDELIHRFGMPLSQMQILTMVEKETLSIGQISKRMGIAKPNITPLVDALIARGYVQRVRIGGDRRVVHVEALPAGRECLREIVGAITEQMRRWPESTTRADLERFDAGLTGMLRFMEQAGSAENVRH